MRNTCRTLLIGVLLLGACTAKDNVVVETAVLAPKQTTTTTTKPTPTTIPEVVSDLPVSDSTTTTTVFVDFPDPVRMFSDALETEADVSDLSQDSEKSDPVEGQVQWYHSKDIVGPCENGLVNMYAHLDKGEPHFNLVDDSSKDKHGKDDHGLVLGDIVNYELTDGTICTYSVIEPFGTDIENVKYIEGETFIYFLKDKTVMNPILVSLLAEIQDRPIVSMWASYGGPEANEHKPPPNDVHRANNAVVFAELVSITEGQK